MEKYKFSTLIYEPTDYDALFSFLEKRKEEALSASSPEELDRILISSDKAISDAEYNLALTFIRSSQDASSKEWRKASQYENTNYSSLNSPSLFSAIVNSPHFPLLEKKYGRELKAKLERMISVTGKAQKERAEETNLVSEYQRKKAMVRISYNGKEMSEGEFALLLEDPSREVRISSRKALLGAFLEKKDVFSPILENLVALRHRIATENGFENYLEYMDTCYGRTGYGETELDAFVSEVKEYAVPLLERINEETRVRLGLDKLMSYDVNIYFPDGNPRPMGDAEFLTGAARAMYSGLSEEMGTFFSGMVESESIDVGFSPKKVSGMGFCTDTKKGMYPFVFGSMDGTASDIAVFTHEVGHAWQGWKTNSQIELSLLKEMPLDAVEIPSKTMELFSYPYASSFFGKDAEKFRYSHIRSAVKEIVNFSSCHELNTWIYTHVGASFDEINEKWMEIQREYHPGMEDGELAPLYREGAGLMRNMGIYMFPRYLISYALSEMCALDLFFIFLDNKEEALEKYNKLCSQGGSGSYVEILSSASLVPAYQKGRVKRAMEMVEAYLRKN